MANPKVKYDPLEAAKLGPDVLAAQPPAPPAQPPRVAVMDPDAAPPARPKFVVTKARRVSIRGNVVDMKVGRVLDSAGYDIEQLRSQGLECQQVEE